MNGRHPAFTLADGGGDLLIGEHAFNAAQGGNRGRRAGAVDPVANAALVLVDALARASGGRRNGQANHPCGVIGVDVENARLRIDCRTAPFAPPAKPGISIVSLSRLGGMNCPPPISLELFHRPRMRFRRTVGHRILGDALLRIRRG